MTTAKKPPTSVKAGPQAANVQPVAIPAATPKPTAASDNPSDAPSDVPLPATQIDTLNPAAVDATLAGLRDLSTYVPNVLGDFDNPSYHIRLFQTPDRDIVNGFFNNNTPHTVKEYYHGLDRFKQVTIAETGTTGYNITGLQIESNVTPSFQSIATNTTSLVMNIVEPNGVSFLDSMKKSALELRIRNVRKCWYFVEITFKGYGIGGMPSTNLLENEDFPNGGRWIWQVAITNIETKLGTAGGEYKLSMLPYTETAFESEVLCTPDMISPEGRTIKEFFENVASQMNDSWELRALTKNFRTYAFKFHGVKGRKSVTGEQVANFSLSPPDPDFQIIRNRDLKAGGEQSSKTTKTGITTPNAPPKSQGPTSAPKSNGTLRRVGYRELERVVKEIIPTVLITSDIRTVAENRKVDGKENSQHLRGTAIDIRCPHLLRPPVDMSPAQLQQKFADRGIAVEVFHETPETWKAPHHYHIQGAKGSKPAPASSEVPKASETDTVGDPNSEPPVISISADTGLPRAQFMRGTSVLEMVTSIFGCCTESLNLAIDSNDNTDHPDSVTASGSDSGSTNAKGFRESVIFRVEPEVRVLGYDPLFNKYSQNIIFHIYGYVTQKPILSPTQVINANEVSVQKKMLAKMVSQGLLKKKYDYIFTGLNSAIIDLDISFNLTWQAALPRLLRNEAFTAQSKYDSNTVEDYKKSQSFLSNYESIFNDRSQAIQERQNAIDAGNIEETNKQTKRQTEADALMKQAGKEITDLRARLNKHLPVFDEKAGASGKREYAENLNIEDIPSLNDFVISMGYVEDDSKNSLVQGVVAPNNNGRAIYGTIMNQLEGQMTNEMMALTMKIKGDPYWIGPGNLEQEVIRTADLDVEHVADYTVGDNVFVLSFAYPLGTDDDGAPKLNKSEMFTGLYRVYKVLHDFTDGKFTQNIEANRMPLVDLYKALATTETK